MSAMVDAEHLLTLRVDAVPWNGEKNNGTDDGNIGSSEVS
jgi:hypothetical protein